MALSQRAVAVTGKDDFALLGELKEAVDRTLGLRQHGLVGRAAATAHGMSTRSISFFSAHLAMRSCAECSASMAVVGPASLEESE